MLKNFLVWGTFFVSYYSGVDPFSKLLLLWRLFVFVLEICLYSGNNKNTIYSRNIIYVKIYMSQRVENIQCNISTSCLRLAVSTYCTSFFKYRMWKVLRGVYLQVSYCEMSADVDNTKPLCCMKNCINLYKVSLVQVFMSIDSGL